MQDYAVHRDDLNVVHSGLPKIVVQAARAAAQVTNKGPNLQRNGRWHLSQNLRIQLQSSKLQVRTTGAIV